MPDQFNNSATVPTPTPAPEPLLQDKIPMPKGVLQKNLKMLLYLGGAGVLVEASILSSKGKLPEKAATKGGPPQPFVQDTTDNNVQALRSQVEAERAKQQQDAALAAAMGAGVNRINPVTGAQYRPGAYLAADTQPGQLGPDQSAAQNTPNVQHQRPSNFVDPHAPGDPPAVEPAGYKRPVEANIDSATGQPYLIYEGTFLDTVLMNRLDGDSSGPVKVLVSNPLYSHDHQHVIIPDGTVVLGEAKKIGAAGFGQQRRMVVVFHRLIMPDGYSVDLDQVQGLDQIGEEGLKDKVNNHYFRIFGTSIALGVIAGASQITQGGGTITTSGSQAFTNGAAGGVSQSASTILDRFIQIPPTITIREGHRVKVYFSQDLLLPAYENHTIPQTF